MAALPSPWSVVMVSNGVLNIPSLRLDKVTPCCIGPPKITKALMGP